MWSRRRKTVETAARNRLNETPQTQKCHQTLRSKITSKTIMTHKIKNSNKKRFKLLKIHFLDHGNI